MRTNRALLLWGLAALPAYAQGDTEAALDAAKQRMRAAVNGCYMSSGAGQHAAGRVELYAQAYAGELVNVVVNSELNNPDFDACVCERAGGALSGWSAAVDADDAVTLPYILSPSGGGGQTYPKQAHTCALAPATSVGPTEPEQATTYPPGAITLRKLKAKGGLDSAAVGAALQARWGELEQCYRADLIRYEGYAAPKVTLELLIDPGGATSSARLDGLSHNSITNCQVQLLRELTFPASDAPSRVKARLAYAPGS